MPTTDPQFTVLRQGDPDAWRSLFETYGEPLYLFAYHHCCGDAAAAEDVRQETLIAAIERIDSYREEAPLFGWLCGIARHKAADWARRRKREPGYAGLSAESEDEALI